MLVTTTPQHYEITFLYDPKLTNFCKNLQGAQYKPEIKSWTAVRNIPNAIDLRREGYYVDVDILEKAPEVIKKGGYLWKIDADLFPHQESWKRLSEGEPKLLLHAEMGLGKTLMSMLWLQNYGVNPRDVLVVCPNSLLLNWVAEFKKFTGEEAHAVMGTTAQRIKALEKPGMHIISYDYVAVNAPARKGTTMKEDKEGRKAYFWKLLSKKSTIIFDESHKVKNPSSMRSKVIHKFFSQRERCLLLTGTPLSQGPQDYYSQFKLINSELLGASYTAFKNRYCFSEQVRGAPMGVSRIIGYKNLDELTRIIEPYTVTFLKKDCLNLPEKIYSVRHVELSSDQRMAYNQMHSDMLLWLQERSETSPITANNILTRLLKLSQITQGFISQKEDEDTTTLHVFKENPKLDALEEILEELAGDPLVITCRFKFDILQIRTLLNKLKISYSVIDGSVPAKDRQQIAEDFQAGKFRVMLGELRTLGVGFNLTQASTMVCYSNNYSLVDRLQAEDRIHRIGSVGRNCHYIDLVAQKTVDEEVISAIRSKQEVANMLTQLRLNF